MFAEREVVDSSPGFPLRQAALQIAFNSSGGLVALLCRFREQPHDDGRDHRRDAGDAFSRRDRLPGEVAVHPFQRIGRRERQRSGGHFVEHDAERVEVAARIDRSVQPPGLFRRHVGQRARDYLG